MRLLSASLSLGRGGQKLSTRFIDLSLFYVFLFVSLLFSLLGAVYLGNELSQQSGADADREKNGKLCECYSLRLLFTLWVSFSVYAYICMSSISLSLCLCPSRPGLLKAGDPGLPWLADSWPSTSLPANSGLGAPKDLTNFGRGGKLSRGYNTAKEKA